MYTRVLFIMLQIYNVYTMLIHKESKEFLLQGKNFLLQGKNFILQGKNFLLQGKNFIQTFLYT